VRPVDIRDPKHAAGQLPVEAGRVPRVVNVQLSGPAIAIVAAGLLAIWALFNLWEVIVVISAAFIFMAAALPYVAWLVQR